MNNSYNDIHAAIEAYKTSDLMHYRTVGSKNGISRDPNYTPIGELAGSDLKNANKAQAKLDRNAARSDTWTSRLFRHKTKVTVPTGNEKTKTVKYKTDSIKNPFKKDTIDVLKALNDKQRKAYYKRASEDLKVNSSAEALAEKYNLAQARAAETRKQVAQQKADANHESRRSELADAYTQNQTNSQIKNGGASYDTAQDEKFSTKKKR